MQVIGRVQRSASGKGWGMKVNEKDLMSGLFLIVIAAVGLYLNQEHTMGSARRMGPGYMPWMVFWLQVGLGAGAGLIGLLGDGENLARWRVVLLTVATSRSDLYGWWRGYCGHA